MFTIIIPVYNVGDYIYECLNSIIYQTYTNYEVLIINDGSTDNSLNIIEFFLDKYRDLRFKLYSKTNGGLSDARNYGVQFAKGKYLIFLDSDDFWDKYLLETIHNEFSKYDMLELVRIPKRIVTNEGREISVDNINEFHCEKGEKAICLLRKNRITFETAWSYSFRLEYWKKQKANFSNGRVHEDLGTIPRLIIQSNSVSSICGHSYYNYRQRENSIITNNSEVMLERKLTDLIFFYEVEKKYIEEVDCANSIKELYLQYYADAVLLRFLSLSVPLKKKYFIKIKNLDLLNDYPVTSFNNLKKRIFYFLYLYYLKKTLRT